MPEIMTTNLFLTSVNDTAAPLLLRKRAAATRIGTNITYFKQLVAAGVIPYVTHPGRSEKLYPVDALDAYVRGLKRCRMGQRENQLIALEGAK